MEQHGLSISEKVRKLWSVKHVANTIEVLPPRRDANGRWLRGTPSPNPSGCIPRDGREVLELAREGSLAAMRRLIAIVNDGEAPYAAQIAAANAVLDRAWGRPKQDIAVEDKGRSLEDLLRDVYEARQAKEAAPEPGEQKGAEPESAWPAIAKAVTTLRGEQQICANGRKSHSAKRSGTRPASSRRDQGAREPAQRARGAAPVSSVARVQSSGNTALTTLF